MDTNDLKFSDLKEDYEQVDEIQTVTVTNTGDTTVSLKVPQSDCFDILTADGNIAESGVQLEAGASLTFQIQPKNGLTKGEYSETLIFGTEESEEAAAQVTAEVSVKEAEEQIISVEADPTVIGYDDLKVGYDTPGATTITLTNTGNTAVTLIQPEAQYFEIGALSATELAAGESAAFAAVPVAGLEEGSYSETLQIMWADSDGQTSVAAEWKVTLLLQKQKRFTSYPRIRQSWISEKQKPDTARRRHHRRLR